MGRTVRLPGMPFAIDMSQLIGGPPPEPLPRTPAELLHDGKIEIERKEGHFARAEAAHVHEGLPRAARFRCERETVRRVAAADWFARVRHG